MAQSDIAVFGVTPCLRLNWNKDSGITSVARARNCSHKLSN